MKELYPDDIDFDEIYFQFELATTNRFFGTMNFYLKIKMGHFGIAKTLEIYMNIFISLIL